MTYSKSHFLSILLVCSMCLIGASRAQANDVASCYSIDGIETTYEGVRNALFILVDETTPLDENLKSEAMKNIGSLLGPDTSFVVASFSSFSSGRYFRVAARGQIESQFDKDLRDSTRKNSLKTFDGCLKNQLVFSRKLVAKTVRESMSVSDNALPNSDVAAALSKFSVLIKDSRAEKKLLFVISDMLENSSVSSFYNRGSVKKLDASKEMDLFKKSDLMGDFSGARIFVLGAGVVQSDFNKASNQKYRDPKTMGALKNFWRSYFENSGGELVEFGSPSMARTLAW